MPNNGDGNAYPYDGRTRPEWFQTMARTAGPHTQAFWLSRLLAAITSNALLGQKIKEEGNAIIQRDRSHGGG